MICIFHVLQINRPSKHFQSKRAICRKNDKICIFWARHKRQPAEAATLVRHWKTLGLERILQKCKGPENMHLDSLKYGCYDADLL